MGFDLNPKTSLWALVDCNNFYCSCERLFRPDLRNQPVVVLSNNDGCIVSRSNEAKALGIKMGEPEFKIRGFLQRQGVTAFSSNYALYGDLSSRVIRCMESMAPEVKQYSIDEAFIPLHSKALAANANELCAILRSRILRWTGIPVTIGIGATKTLAKLAAELGKKMQRANVPTRTLSRKACTGLQSGAAPATRSWLRRLWAISGESGGSQPNVWLPGELQAPLSWRMRSAKIRSPSGS